jgi:hypothetical protein
LTSGSVTAGVPSAVQLELKMALPVAPKPFGASPGARRHEDIVGVERFVAFEPQPFQAPGRFAIVLVTEERPMISTRFTKRILPGLSPSFSPFAGVGELLGLPPLPRRHRLRILPETALRRLRPLWLRRPRALLGCYRGSPACSMSLPTAESARTGSTKTIEVTGKIMWSAPLGPSVLLTNT